jgi:FkbM family methyltransferase
LSSGIHIGKAINATETKIVLDSIARMGTETVLDIGANSGQFASKLIQTSFSGAIYSYEPDPEIFLKLLQASSMYSNWHAENCAITSEEISSGKLILNVSSNSGYSSSIRSPSRLLSQTYKEIEFHKKIEVKAKKLSLILEDLKGTSILVKADVQGAERDIFQNLDLAGQHSIKAVFLELSHFEIYEGEWTFLEALSYFSDNGFHLRAVAMEDYSKELGAIQSNLLFERG